MDEIISTIFLYSVLMKREPAQNLKLFSVCSTAVLIDEHWQQSQRLGTTGVAKKIQLDSLYWNSTYI